MEASNQETSNTIAMTNEQLKQDAEHMEKLVLEMNVPDTARVKSAEKEIRAAIKGKECVPVLLQVLRFSEHSGARQLSAVLLRLALPKFWNKIQDEGFKLSAKRLLLECLANEGTRIVCINTTYVIAEITKCEDEEQVAKWQDLLNFLQTFAQSTNPNQQEVAMRLFYALTETIGTVFRPHFTDLKNMYATILQQSTDSKVRVAALKASGALIQFLSSGDEVLMFRDLVPLILQGLQSNLEDEIITIQILQVLTELAESPVPVLNKYIKKLVLILISMLKSDNLELGTKQVATNCLKTIIVYKTRFVSKLGAMDNLVETAIMCLTWDYPHFVSVLSEQELSQQEIQAKKEQRSQGEDNFDDQEDYEFDFGHTLVDAIASSLPRHSFKSLIQAAIQNVQVQDRNHQLNGTPVQWIGLSLLLHSAEGLSEMIIEEENMLQKLLETVIPIARNSPDPINRATALMCILEWLQYLSETIQPLIPAILPTAIALLEDPSSHLVRACAGDLVELICEDIEDDEILPHVEQLAGKLLFLARNGVNANVQSTALSALSSVMVSAGSAYMPYFDSTVTALGEFATIEDPTFYQVRGHAICALGNLALACSFSNRGSPGSNNLDKFEPLLSIVLSNAANNFEFEDMELNQLTYAALGILADAFGERIQPYAETMCEMLICSQFLDEDAQLNYDDPDGVLVPESIKNQFGAGGTENPAYANGGSNDAQVPDEDEMYQPGVRYEISIRSEVVAAKQSALQSLSRVALNASPSFVALNLVQMIETCTKVLTHIHPELKTTAIEAMATFIKAAGKCFPLPELNSESKVLAFEWARSCYHEYPMNQKWLPGMPPRSPLDSRLVPILQNTIVEPLLSVMAEEKEKSVVAACFSTLETLVSTFGPAGLGNHVEDTISLCISVFADKSYCQRLDIHDDEDDENDTNEFDDEEEEEDDRNTMQLFDNACDLISMIANALGPTIQSYVPAIFQPLATRMHRGQKRRSGTIGVFVRVIVALGPNGAENYVENLVPIALACLEDDDTITRQNASYLIGNLVAFGSAKIQQKHASETLLQILQKLQIILKDAPACAEACRQYESEEDMPYDLLDKQCLLDNACGALARILLSCSSDAIPVNDSLLVLLQTLPLRSDHSEQYPVMKCLSHFVSVQNQTILAHVEQIVRIVAKTLIDVEYDDPESRESRQFALIEMQQMMRSVFDIVSSGNANASQILLEKLDAEEKAAIGHLMSS